MPASWPYAFLTLTPDQVQARRTSIDRAAALAHYASLLPTVLGFALQLARHLWRQHRQRRAVAQGYQAVPADAQAPRSPVLKSRRTRTACGVWARRWRVWAWWLGDDLRVFGWSTGPRNVWVFGTVWAAWLLAVCVVGTGNDYLHLTKRFGAIALSQLPVHYILSFKALNPIALAWGTSHEELNRWHRALGRIIYLLLALHAAFYLNFLAQSGLLWKRLSAPDIAAGAAAFAGLTLLYITSIHPVPQFSYRLFFIVHFLVGSALPLLLFFHAPSARVYIVAAFVALLADIAYRRLSTMAVPAHIAAIPNTDLLRITAGPLPAHRFAAFTSRPASHVYVTIPPESRAAAPAPELVYEFLLNPFSVAAVDAHARTLTLVVRRQRGPTTTLLAAAAEASIQLGIDGPYGAVGRGFATLVGPDAVDRVLLVAGGVGAAFAVPTYRAIREQSGAVPVELVWAVRSAGDAAWVVDAASEGDGQQPEDQGGLLQDQRVHLFMTRDELADDPDGNDEPGISMQPVRQEPPGGTAVTAKAQRKRPDLRAHVDGVFRHGSEERVAVLICGPAEMARELRQAVAVWVRRGREVVWHDEGFEW